MNRHAMTLVEMLVVILILGLLGGMSVLAVGRLRRPDDTTRVARWRRARAAAIRSGQPVTVRGDSGMVVRFLPDGRALGPGVDPLTGDIRDTGTTAGTTAGATAEVRVEVDHATR